MTKYAPTILVIFFLLSAYFGQYFKENVKSKCRLGKKTPGGVLVKFHLATPYGWCQLYRQSMVTQSFNASRYSGICCGLVVTMPGSQAGFCRAVHGPSASETVTISCHEAQLDAQAMACQRIFQPKSNFHIPFR